MECRITCAHSSSRHSMAFHRARVCVFVYTTATRLSVCPYHLSLSEALKCGIPRLFRFTRAYLWWQSESILYTLAASARVVGFYFYHFYYIWAVQEVNNHAGGSDALSLSLFLNFIGVEIGKNGSNKKDASKNMYDAHKVSDTLQTTPIFFFFCSTII